MMKSLRDKTDIIFDLFFSLVFMPLMIAIGPVHFWWHSFPVFTALVVGYLYGCYFATRFFKLPKLILSRSYIRLSLIAAAGVAATWLLTMFPLPDMDFVIPSMSEYQTRIRNYNIAISIWFMFSVVMSYSLTVAFVRELYERLFLQTIAEKQRKEAELAMFKAQISPHFLFNTLNSLYCLVIGTSQKAEDAFVKFTEILRYTYVAGADAQVEIRNEIEHIRNYIDLQLIRLDSHTTVRWDCQVDDDSCMIPPMLFLTFVENAFKYGTSTTRDCFVSIVLKLESGNLFFSTENMIVRKRSEFSSDLPVGLSNCRSRLDCLYPGRHELVAVEENMIFKVNLKIDLN